MLCSLLKCYAYQRTPSYIISTHNLFIHNFKKLLLCINKNKSIRRIHWFKYPWNLFQCRIQLCWIIFWLRIIKLSVFFHIVSFSGSSSMFTTCSTTDFELFSYPLMPSHQLWCSAFLDLTRRVRWCQPCYMTAAWPRAYERSKGFILIIDLFKGRKWNVS